MSEKLKGVEWTTSSSKRSFDIAAATALLPIVLPVTALGAAAFTLENGMNPLFMQDRMSTDDQPLKVAKLRTMPFRQDLADGSQGYRDARATRIGRLMRMTTLDESPQLFQVLGGQMSIVGPRPLIAGDIERTMDILSPSEQVAWKHARLGVKPGLASDFGNLSRSLSPQTDDYLLARVDADHHYAETASWVTDARIIQETLLRAVRPVQPVVSESIS